MGALVDQFGREDRSRHSEWLRQQRWFIKSRQDQQRREEIADKIEDGVAALATEVVIATQAQIKTFEVKLDSYDAATVTALMENQDLIDAVKDRIADMLARAYVMQDGRRVFKTEDGTQVFDELGVEIPPEELDPDLIDDNRPTYEEYATDAEALAELEAERAQILEFQEKVDGARDRIAEREITEAELEDLDAELMEAMPPAVRGHISSLSAVENHSNPATEFTGQASNSERPTQVVETRAVTPMPFQ